MSQNKRLTSGFTLLELLVVIAIIGIFASIVLTVLSAAKTKAQMTKLRSDAHNIITQIDIQRTAQNKILPQIEAGLCPYCGVGVEVRIKDAPEYVLDQLNVSWQRLGYDSAPLDPWGNPFIFLPKEYVSGDCWKYDQVYSAGPDGYVPTYFSPHSWSDGPVGVVTPGEEDDYVFSVPFYNCTYPG